MTNKVRVIKLDDIKALRGKDRIRNEFMQLIQDGKLQLYEVEQQDVQTEPEGTTL